MEHNNHLATEVAVTKKDIDFLKDGFLRLEKSLEEHKKESKERIDSLWNRIVTMAVFGGIMISGFYALDLYLHPSEAQFKESVEKRFNDVHQDITEIKVTQNILLKNKSQQ